MEIQKKLFFLFVFFPALSALCQTENTLFKDANGVYQLSIPGNWGSNVNSKNVVVITPPKESLPRIDAACSILIRSDKLTKRNEGINIKDLAITEQEKIKKSRLALNGTFINSSFININGKDWWQYEYKASNPYEMHEKTWEAIQNGITYSITYNTISSKQDIFEDYVSKADAITNSFSFLQKDLTVYKERQLQNNKNLDLSTPQTIQDGKIRTAKIKADRLFQFSEGFAIVGYGNANAIIDRTGNFLVPYNNFYIEDFGLGTLEPLHGFINGGCVVKNVSNQLLGMVGTKGDLIIPTQYMLVYPFDTEGWARVTDSNNKDFFINKSGAKIPISSVFFAYNSNPMSRPGGLSNIFNGGPTRERALSGLEYIGSFSKSLSPGLLTTGGYSFFNRAGKQIIGDKFTSAEPFYDDLACVSKVNEFGETKYGFIDKSGKQVISFMFSKKPGNFYYGLAYVEPASRGDFSFSFLNKKGEIVFKQMNSKPVLTQSPHFEDGYFRMWYNGKFKIIDTLGQDVDVSNSIKKVIPEFKTITNASYPFSNHIQVFNFQNGISYGGLGYINVETKNVGITVFNSISSFDSVSGLSLIMEQKNGGPKYINQSGKIVIELADKSQW